MVQVLFSSIGNCTMFCFFFPSTVNLNVRNVIDFSLHLRCLLASLTNYGAVTIHTPRKNQWIDVANLSELWREYLRQSWRKPCSNLVKDYFDELQERAYALKTTGKN